MMKYDNQNNKNSRREFCKNSALVTAGIMMPSTTINSMFNVFNDKKLKLALVGCGGQQVQQIRP